MGYVIFNEDKVEYDDGKVEVQVATFVHELLHCLYFHPKLFDHFPDTRSGKPYMFEDENEDFKLRGDNILNHVRSHFDCDDIDGGTRRIYDKFNQQPNWHFRTSSGLLQGISIKRFSEKKSWSRIAPSTRYSR